MGTFDGVTNVLREDLDISRENIGTFEKELVFVKTELKTARNEFEIVSQSVQGGPRTEEVLDMSRDLANVRSEYQEMRHETVKELNRVKLEMTEKTREMTTACLEVYTNSQFITDSEGKQILVGNLSELWEKLQITKLEKKVEEERADQLEEERDLALRDVNVLAKRLEDLRILQENDDKENWDKKGDQVSARRGQLEAQNVLLQSSMQDIASMVVMDSTQDILSSSRPRPIIP